MIRNYWHYKTEGDGGYSPDSMHAYSFTKAMLVLCISAILFSGCSIDKEKNMRPMEQKKLDNSNDYRFIFKDILTKEKSNDKKNKKDPFKE